MNSLWILPLIFMLSSCSTINSQISASDPSHLSEQWKAHNQWWENIEDGDFALYVLRPEKAIQYFDKAIDQANAFGENDPRRAKSYISLGRAYMEESKFENANATLIKGLELKQKLHGKDSNELSGVLNNLALVSFKLNNLKEAKSLNDRAFELRKAAKDYSGSSELNYVKGLILSQTKDASTEEVVKTFDLAIKEFDSDFASKKILLDTVALKNFGDCLSAYSRWLVEKKETDKTVSIHKKLEMINRYLSEFKTKN